MTRQMLIARARLVGTAIALGIDLDTIHAGAEKGRAGTTMTETIERALTLGEAMRAPGYVGNDAAEAGDLLIILAREIQRLTTPRPIAEAPKDGTWVLGIWDCGVLSPEVMRWNGTRWTNEEEEHKYTATHYLPLPVLS